MRAIKRVYRFQWQVINRFAFRKKTLIKKKKQDWNAPIGVTQSFRRLLRMQSVSPFSLFEVSPRMWNHPIEVLRQSLQEEHHQISTFSSSSSTTARSSVGYLWSFSARVTWPEVNWKISFVVPKVYSNTLGLLPKQLSRREYWGHWGAVEIHQSSLGDKETEFVSRWMELISSRNVTLLSHQTTNTNDDVTQRNTKQKKVHTSHSVNNYSI